jgi:sugar lactone lactonase YvrE
VLLVARVLICAAALTVAPLHAADEPPRASLAVERALAEAPGDPVLAYFLAYLRAREGNRDGALAALEQTLALGRGFLPTPDAFPALKDDARFDVLRARFAKRLPVRTDGRIAFSLPDRRLLPEGIAYDPIDRAFYVGSIARNGIYRILPGGRLRLISRPEDNLDAVLGMAIDARTRRLFAVSTNALIEAGRAQRRNAIKVYDLKSGRLQASIDVPEARQLNDVAVVPGGTLVATDSAGGGVFRVDPASGAVSVVAPPGTVPGANGIAVSPEGDVAWVAASRRPLRIDLATGARTPLSLPQGENAAAIDGLYWHDRALIGIQNMTTPARIVRLALSEDGARVDAVQTLQSHHQRAFDEPTTAAIAPDGLYVLARTQVSFFNDRGSIDRADTLAPPLVLRVPLR